ncbi:MAG: aspartate/glutamate racemase family protein [Melioribacteraceae bacterium]
MKKFRIIVTDSGLGGLSVHALLDKYLRSLKSIPDVEIIFFNSVAEHNLGYNVMKTESRKLKVFNNALASMLSFNPDIILIACNTLSVLYSGTQISKSPSIPIISIIDLGVEMILESISQNTKERIIIFGTDTTIKSNKHKLQLIESNVKENKIIIKACKDLESEIQINSNSKRVSELIDICASEALRNITDDVESLIVVLACTHYGYSLPLFQKNLSKKFKGKIKILNPNEKMGSSIEIGNTNSSSPTITNKVISRVDISKEEMGSIGLLLKKDSQSVAEALENYILDVNLFEVD